MKSIDALSRNQARQLIVALGLSNARLPLLLPGAARSSVPLAPEATPEDVCAVFRLLLCTAASSRDLGIIMPIMARCALRRPQYSWTIVSMHLKPTMNAPPPLTRIASFITLHREESVMPLTYMYAGARDC